MSMTPEQQARVDAIKKSKREAIDPATMTPEQRQRLNVIKSNELGGSIIDPIARGSSFNLNDEISGAVGGAYQSIMPESMGGNQSPFLENYGNIRDDIRERTKAYATAYPGRAFGGEMAGAMLGGGAGFSNFLRGKTGVELAKAGAAVGAAEGGIQGFGASENESPFSVASDIGTGMAMGGLAGGVMPLAIGAMKKGGGWLFDKLPFDSVQDSRAARFVKDMMEEGGETQRQVLERERRMVDAGADPTFTETANTGIPMAQGVIAEKPGLRAVGVENISNRMKGAPNRVADVVDETLDFRPPRIDEVDRLATKAMADSGPLYAKMAHAVPDFDDTLQDLFQRDAIKKAWPEAKALASNEGRDLPELFTMNDAGEWISTGKIPDFKSWDYIKRALYRVEDQASTNAFGKKDSFTRSIANVRNKLVSHLDDQYPDYASARTAWGGPASAAELVNRGQRMFKMNTQDAIAEIKRLTADEKKYFMTGVWSEIQEKMGKPAGEGFVSAYSFLRSDNVKKKLRALLPEGDIGDKKMEKLYQSLKNEWRLKDANNKVVENSQTSARQSAHRKLQGTGPGLSDVTESPLRSMYGAASKAMNRMPQKQIGELGNLLMKPGGTQDVFDFVNQLAIPMSQRENLRGSAIRGFDAFAPFGMAGGSAMIHPLDQAMMR